MQAQAMKTCTRRPRSAPKPRRKGNSAAHLEADYQYRQALQFVQRRTFVTLADIRGLGILTEPARQILLRMQREGVLTAPDMFGTWTRAVAEVQS